MNTLKYKYTSLYLIRGITFPKDQESVVVLEDNQRGVRGIITKSPDSYCYAVDTHYAIASFMLRGLLGDKDGQSFESILKEEIESSRSKRKSDGDNPVFYVIEIEGIAEFNEETELKSIGDQFRICFDGVEKESIINANEAVHDELLASVLAGYQSMYSIELVTSGITFKDDEDRIVLSYSPKVGKINAHVAKLFKEESIESVKELSVLIKKSPNLKSVYRQYIASFDRKQGNLESFLSVWTSLEIFINKVFNDYRDAFFRNLKLNVTLVNADVFLSRIEAVMKDKYRITDKFDLIAAYLEKAADKDVPTFSQIKKIRDEILHGKDVDVEKLPIEETQALLRKYLEAHLRR